MICVGWLLAIMALGVWALGAMSFLEEVGEFLRGQLRKRGSPRR